MVYIIEAVSDGKSIFKIGTTGNCPWQRLKQLRRQNAIPLKLVAGMIGDKDDEARFHRLFHKWRSHGEWFSDNSGLRQLVSDFPIKEWDQVTSLLQWEGMELKDAYIHLTTLKFEPCYAPYKSPLP